MKTLTFVRTGLLAASLVIPAALARADSSPTPHQIQALIASGQDQAALQDLNQVLAAHPDSGIAWYLTAEAQDATGNEAAARAALAKAEQISPGLPFADPGKVAALQAHLNGGGNAAGGHGGGIGLFILLAGAVLVFLFLRGLLRRRRPMMPYQDGFNPGFQGRPNGPFPGGPGYGSGYGPGYGQGGGGLGSSILGGLAAGAGFAAGERIIDGMFDGNRGNPGIDPGIDPAYGADPTPAPDRDDGLLGSPDWGGGDSGGGSDDNSW